MARQNIRIAKATRLNTVPRRGPQVKNIKTAFINTGSRKKIGDSGEKIVSMSVQHCGKPLRDLNKTEGGNFAAVDHICDNCATGFQVKTSSSLTEVDGNFHIHKSKTFDATCAKYRYTRYIIVNYSKQTGALKQIIVSPRLSLDNIHEEYESILVIPKDRCVIQGF